MLNITKENIVPYLKERMPELADADHIHISQVGEGDPEEDGDGYVNYSFRVHTDKGNYVLKQGRELARTGLDPMAMYRNGLEYDSMRIRYAIVPEYTPFLKFQDKENNLFVMEDVSDLKITRFQFNKNRMFPDLGRRCGECMAKTEFYTSEYFLSREEYRQLQTKFANTQMRRVMEDGAFMDIFNTEVERGLGEEYNHFARGIMYDHRFETERFKLRRNFMSHADGLIHGDLHTSNIFASEDAMKVIDMEFSFMGPFGYDLGYLTGNLISQYCAACFKPFASEAKRREFKAYLLATIKSLFETYFKTFIECWKKDAKERYQGAGGLCRSILDEVMRDAPGYASIVNWFRCTGEIEYPDFDVIENLEDKRHAQTLSLMMDWQLMFQRYQFMSVDDLIDTVLFVEEEYRKAL